MAPTLQKNLYVGANTQYTSRLIPAADGRINGVNIGALNARTRASGASAEACVSSWVTRASAADNDWISVTWAPELSLFVAVAWSGVGNRVATSPDGIIWTTRASAADNEWRSVIWSPELFIFVVVAITGTGNRVMTSPNGITWTTRESPVDNRWFYVTWAPELSIFVAIADTGTGNRVMTSSNGIIWTTRESAADNGWTSITWAPELSIFVAVAISGTGNRVMTSSNGINWATRASAIDNDWYSVIWAPELSLFVAVGQTGTGNRVITSPDGITWTSRTSAADNNWRSVTWAPELSLFLAVTNTGTGNRVMTSQNGITWTTRASAADNSWFCVIWAPELSIFLTVAGTGPGNRVMTSAIGMPNSKSVVKALPSQVTVLANGYMGIGTTNPKVRLHVQAGVQGTYGYTQSGNILIGYNNDNHGINIANYNANAGGGFSMIYGSSTQPSGYQFIVYEQSGFGNTFIVGPNGNVSNRNNSYGAFSDIKLKENITDSPSQWNDIKNIKIRNYNLKILPNEPHIGVIAQEVQEISPNLIEESSDGNLSVKYSILYLKAVKALQEAMQRIETLETQVAALILSTQK